MARCPAVVTRKYTWGSLSYDTVQHRFSYREYENRGGEPYPSKPVVLNIVITRSCNMDCDYCVARGFTGVESENLLLSADMIRWLNHSPFMLLVLTGGEPLMPPHDTVSMRLIDSIEGRGLILDTNGTFMPSRATLSRLKKKGVMIRVSMDSISENEERKVRHAAKGQVLSDHLAFRRKLNNIERFLAAGVCTAVQTVLWKKNSEDVYDMIDWLSQHGVKRWYLQRLIPSYRFRAPSRRFALPSVEDDYCSLSAKIAKEAQLKGIECVPKMDLRHNSVFMLAGDGAIYTQGEAPGQKVPLGTIRDDIEYFDYVSPADHACRYYLAERVKTEADAITRRGQHT